MAKVPLQQLGVLTWLALTISALTTAVWIYFLFLNDGWGHFWFILLLAPISFALCALGALVPNWDAFTRTKDPIHKRRTILAGISVGLIVLEALISILIPKSGC